MSHRAVSWALFVALLPASTYAGDLGEKLFDAQEHDFGKVQRGERLTHRFLLHNTTDNEVRIKRIRVSCGCTTASMSSERIGPGETALLDAVMDTSGFQGSKSVTIFVQFERPWRGEASLRLSCTSIGNLGQGASEVDFGVIPVGTGAVKRLNLDYTGNPKWAITGLDFGHPAVKAEVAEVSRDAQLVRYELTIHLAPTAPSGPLEDRIRIHTNDPATSEVVVLAKAKIEPKLTAAPDHLHLSELIPGQKITKNVLLKAGAPFKVVRVDNTGGMFEIRSSPEPKKTQLLVITLTVPEDVSKVPPHVDVVTDLEDQTISLGVRD